jgi:DNA mismatch repair ATPase MutS
MTTKSASPTRRSAVPSPLAAGATLRVQSRFFAEITRLRQIFDLAKGPVPVLFLLDELLSGTNSVDHRAGAEAVLRRLVEAGAVGMVTTHDLALTAIDDPLGPVAADVHFDERLENGQLVFDHTMRPGVVRQRNALALMRAVGIEV